MSEFKARPRPANRKPNHSSPISAAERADLPAGLEIRQVAVKLLAAVIEAKTSLDGMTDDKNGHPAYRGLEPRDRALLRAILTSALRYRGTISHLISQRLDRPLPGNAHALVHILHVAATQILFLDIPDHAAVDVAVTQAKLDPRTRRFDKLVNALLRGISRGKAEELPKALSEASDAPDWLVERLRAAYGADKTRAILNAHRIEPSIDFTVKSDGTGWAEKLGGVLLPTGSVRVARLTTSVPQLPGFEDGEWWVQDAAAAIPARLVGAAKGQRIGDLCAAPGGKTAQLALTGADVTAFDISRNRLKRLEQNLQRLGLEVTTVETDLRDYKPETPFDAVLVDAPCSSTGTIRRHPDVCWTKGPDDVEKLATLQYELLLAATHMVTKGGRIVFSNCSLDPSEGEELVARLLRDNKHVEIDPVTEAEFPDLAPFITKDGMIRTTPADLPMEIEALSGLDGFFAVRLTTK